MIQGIDFRPRLSRGYSNLDEIFIFTDLSGRKSKTAGLNFFNVYRTKHFSIEEDDGGALNGGITPRPGMFFDNSIDSVNQGRMVYQLNGYYNAQKAFENNIAGMLVTVKSHIDDNLATTIYNKQFAFNLPPVVSQGQQNLDPGSSNSRVVQNKIKFATTDPELMQPILARGGAMITVNELPHSNNEISQDLEFGKSFENISSPFLGSRALSSLAEHYMGLNKRIPELIGVNHSYIPAPLDFLSLNSTEDGEITGKLEPAVEALSRQPMVQTPVDEMAGFAGRGSAQSYAEFDLSLNHASVLSHVGRSNVEPRDYMDHNQMIANARSTRDIKVSNQLLNAIMSISPGQRSTYRVMQSSFNSDFYRFNALIELDINQVLDNPQGEAISVHLTPLEIVSRPDGTRKIDRVPDESKKITFALHPYSDYKVKVNRAIVPPTIKVLKNTMGEIVLKIIRNDPCPLPIVVYRQYYNPSSGEYTDLSHVGTAHATNDNFAQGYYDTIRDANVENVHPLKVIYKTIYQGSESWNNGHSKIQAGATASIVINGIPYDIDPAGLVDSAVYERRDCAIVALNKADHVSVSVFNLPKDAISISLLRHKIGVGSVGASAIGSRSQNKVVATYRGDADTDFPSELQFRDRDPQDGDLTFGDFENNSFYIYKIEITTTKRKYIAPEEEIIQRIRPKNMFEVSSALTLRRSGQSVLDFRPFVVGDPDQSVLTELTRLIASYGSVQNSRNQGAAPEAQEQAMMDQAADSLNNLHFFEVEFVNLRTGYRSSMGFVPSLRDPSGHGVQLPQFADDTMIIAHHCVVANGFLNPQIGPDSISGVNNPDARRSLVQQEDDFAADGRARLNARNTLAKDGSTSLYGGSLHTGLISTFMQKFGAIPANRNLIGLADRLGAGGVLAMGRTGLTATSVYRVKSELGPDIPSIDDLFGTQVLEAVVHSSGRAEIVWNVRGRVIAPPDVNGANTFKVPMKDYIDYFIVSCYLDGNHFVLGTVDCVFTITTNTRRADHPGDERFYFIDDKMPNEIGARVYAVTAVGYDPSKRATKYVDASGLSITNLSSVPLQLLSNNTHFGSA